MLIFEHISINNKPEVVYKARNDDDTNPLSAYERRNSNTGMMRITIPHLLNESFSSDIP